MLSGTLLHERLFVEFFNAVPQDNAAFDVTLLPAFLWPNLYMVTVRERRLLLSVIGDQILHVFKRDLRGVDLRSITHGPAGERITDGYDQALDEHKRIIMQRTVHFEQQGLTRVVECGFAPLIKEGAVVRIVGCLFLTMAEAGQPSFGQTGFAMEDVDIAAP